MQPTILTLGVVPTRRHMYDPKHALANKETIFARVRALTPENIRIVDIDWLGEEGIFSDPADTMRIAARLKAEGVDALFTPHLNFGTEETVGRLGKAMGVPLLLYGMRDEAPPQEGNRIRQTDTQCGIFATSKVLMRYKVPFTYIENCRIDEDAFAKGYLDFLRTASVVKTFRNMRVGQIGLRPKPFLSVIFNESELLEKFGIETVVITPHEVIRVYEDILANQKEAVAERAADLTQKLDVSAHTPEELAKMAAMELAIFHVAKVNDLSCIGSECWSVFNRAIGISMCFIFADVTDRGLPMGCETDVLGAIGSALLSAASLWQDPTFFADLTLRHPTNDNAELLWHCGPFPSSLAKEKPAIRDFKGQYELKDGPITIARFDALAGEYFLFADEGKACAGPATNGTYVWMEVPNWIAWEKKFVNGPYIHHVSGIYGSYANALHEAAKYIGVTPDCV